MTTLHSAFKPQVPGQGSLHLLFTHALLRSQSVFITHSGLQPVYGSPKYSGKHIQDPAPLRSLHTAFAPQGDGLHGILGPSVGATVIEILSKIDIPRKIAVQEAKNNFQTNKKYELGGTIRNFQKSNILRKMFKELLEIIKVQQQTILGSSRNTY